MTNEEIRKELIESIHEFNRAGVHIARQQYHLDIGQYASHPRSGNHLPEAVRHFMLGAEIIERLAIKLQENDSQ